MNTWHWIAIVAALVGLALGPGSLDSAAAAQPPIRWDDLPFSFVGSVLGMIAVVGFQLLRRDEKYGRWAFRAMGPITAFVTASGVSAIGVALYSRQNGPAAWLFLSAGLGMALGLWACWGIKRRRAKVAP